MLDPKLAVFTVVGTQEPHLVRLFPPTVLLVAGHWDVLPHHGGKDGCRHDAHTGMVNLTQLHRNKRKRADKTSGTKQPRLRDVDFGISRIFRL